MNDSPVYETLPQNEQFLLLDFARQSIRARLEQMRLPVLEGCCERLQYRKGAFVTLTIDERLRGCIGTVMPFRPLFSTVQQAAVSAAFEDPRFPPVTQSELPRTCLEVSVISALREIESIRQIEVNRHGLYIRLGKTTAVLLPQVASRHHWNRETFLAQICLKAGLTRDAWCDSSLAIMTFEAQVFRE